MNNVAVNNLCAHWLSFFLGIHLGVELLSHMVTLCLTSGGTAILFSKVLPFYIPTSIINVFDCSSPRPTLFCAYDYSHPCGCEAVSHYFFNLNFPLGYLMMLSIF